MDSSGGRFLLPSYYDLGGDSKISAWNIKPVTLGRGEGHSSAKSGVVMRMLNWLRGKKQGGDFIVFSDVLWLHPLPHQRVIYL